MKILAMPAYFWPNMGGIETITYALAKEWSANGHDITVLTSRIGATKKKEVLDKIEIQRTGRYSLMGCPFSPGAILKVLRSEPDIIYLHYPHPIFLEMGVLGSILKKIHYVLHVHGPEISYDNWKQVPISIYNNTGLRFALSHAAAIVSHTEATIQSSRLLKQYKNKITVIPHGTALPPIKSNNGLKNGKIILFIGRLRDYKRVDLLIRSFVFVKHQFSDVRLIIVGDGPMHTSWQQLANELGLSDVEFIHHVTEQQKWQYYYACDVFVLPSPTLMESFGTVALEAAVCKKPVIVAGAGVAEVFKKENIGVVVEPYDVQALANAILDLLLHPTKAKRIGEASATIIKKRYLWKERAAEYISLFGKVLNGN